MIRNYVYILGLIKLYIYKLIRFKQLRFSPIIKFDWTATLRLRPRSKMSFSKGVIVGSGTKLRVAAEGTFEVGEGSGFNTDCVVTCRDKIIIGKNVIIASNVSIYDHDHVYKTDKQFKQSGFVTNPIVIEDNVWLGCGVIILKGVTIGRGSVIAAGTVVTKDIPPNSIVYNHQDLVIKKIEK